MNIYASTIPHNAAKSCKPEEEQVATILDSLNKNCKGQIPQKPSKNASSDCGRENSSQKERESQNLFVRSRLLRFQNILAAEIERSFT